MKIKPSRNGKITLSFIDIGKSCLNRGFFTSLVCLLKLFAKINLAKISESTVTRQNILLKLCFVAGTMYIGVSKKKTFHWLVTAYVSNTLTLLSARLLGK